MTNSEIRSKASVIADRLAREIGSAAGAIELIASEGLPEGDEPYRTTVVELLRGWARDDEYEGAADAAASRRENDWDWGRE